MFVHFCNCPTLNLDQLISLANKSEFGLGRLSVHSQFFCWYLDLSVMRVYNQWLFKVVLGPQQHSCLYS